MKKTKIIKQPLLDNYKIETINKESCPICGKLFYLDNTVDELDSHLWDDHPDYYWCNIHQQYEKKETAYRHNSIIKIDKIEIETQGENTYQVVPTSGVIKYIVRANTQDEAKENIRLWLKKNAECNDMFADMVLKDATIQKTEKKEDKSDEVIVICAGTVKTRGECLNCSDKKCPVRTELLRTENKIIEEKYFSKEKHPTGNKQNIMEEKT